MTYLIIKYYCFYPTVRVSDFHFRKVVFVFATRKRLFPLKPHYLFLMVRAFSGILLKYGLENIESFQIGLFQYVLLRIRQYRGKYLILLVFEKLCDWPFVILNSKEISKEKRKINIINFNIRWRWGNRKAKKYWPNINASEFHSSTGFLCRRSTRIDVQVKFFSSSLNGTQMDSITDRPFT